MLAFQHSSILSKRYTTMPFRNVEGQSKKYATQEEARQADLEKRQHWY
jgi:hypothetical protein